MLKPLLAATVLIAQVVPAPAMWLAPAANKKPCMPPMIGESWQGPLPAA
jgi:hypothetical protein